MIFSIRDPIKEFVSRGMPDDWLDIDTRETEIFSSVLQQIDQLTPLSSSEALLLANNLGDNDLDGVGVGLIDVISTAPIWGQGDLYYVNSGKLVVLDLKLENFYAKANFTFYSNMNLKVNVDNYLDNCLLLENPITLVEARFLIAVFARKTQDDLSDLLFSHLQHLLEISLAKGNFRKDLSWVEQEVLKNLFEI